MADMVAPESRVDGCPECVANVEAPNNWYPLRSGGYVAFYRCHDCGHSWTTVWGDE